LRTLVFQAILKMEFGEIDIPEDCHFLSCEWPGHCALMSFQLLAFGKCALHSAVQTKRVRRNDQAGTAQASAAFIMRQNTQRDLS